MVQGVELPRRATVVEVHAGLKDDRSGTMYNNRVLCLPVEAEDLPVFCVARCSVFLVNSIILRPKQRVTVVKLVISLAQRPTDDRT